VNGLLDTGIYWFDFVYMFGYNLYPVTATTVTADLSKVVINLTNFFALSGIRTQPDWPPTGRDYVSLC